MKSIKEMVEELVESGLNQTQIADLTDTSQATINRIIHKGQNLSYEKAQRIAELHKKRIGKTKAA